MCSPVFLAYLLVCKPLLSHVVESSLPQASLHVPLSLFSLSFLSLSSSLLQSHSSLSFLPLSLFFSAPVFSASAPAAPVSALRFWLEPMLHLACPLRPWGHTWRVRARQAPAQGRPLWPEVESRRMRGGLWAGERPAGILGVICWLILRPAEQDIKKIQDKKGRRF